MTRPPPTLPTAFRSVRTQRWVLRDHVPSFVILFVGMAATIVVTMLSHRTAVDDQRRQLARRANNVAAAFDNGLALWLEVLSSLGSLYDASDEVTDDDFAEFALPALARHPAVSALEWFEEVPDADRAAFEAKGREHHPDFAVRAPDAHEVLSRRAVKASYLALRYAQPINASVPWGLDLYFDPQRTVPVAEARDSGQPRVSGRVRLVEDAPGVYSVAAHLPIYRHGMPHDSVESRRTAFQGVVVELLRLEQIADHAIGKYDLTGIEVTLIDTQAQGDDRVLLHRGKQVADGGLSWTVAAPFGGRAWALHFKSAPEASVMHGIAGLLAGGLALTLLFAVIVSAQRALSRLRRAVMLAQRVGQYTLEAKIGEGGIGVVYRARHAMLRRPTALKILKAESSDKEQQLARFETEVQLTAQLSHPNTIVVFDYGRTPDNTFYYAMEFIDGVDFEALVAEDGPQPAERVAHLLAQAVGSLTEAHGIGLIHRDIKPANLMLCHRGGVPDVVKVLDFGLVTTTATTPMADVESGTPLYMAPEILRNQSIDARSDLYALGLVAYFLVTGKRAVQGRVLAEVVHQHLSITPLAPSAALGQPVHAGLAALIMRCLAKEPKDRPASAIELGQAIAALGLEWPVERAEAWWNARKSGPHARARTPGEVAFNVSLDGRR